MPEERELFLAERGRKEADVQRDQMGDEYIYDYNFRRIYIPKELQIKK